MNVVVSIDHRYFGTPDGAVWTSTNCGYPFWLRYLEVFDSVRIVARVRLVTSVPDHWQRVDGENVSVAAVPFYVGPVQYLLKAAQVQQAVKNAVNLTDAVILRVPSNVANCIYDWVRHTNQPYALEVVGDPYNFFAPGSVKHPLRPFFRSWFTHKLKNKCIEAAAVSYVTKQALQQRYPSSQQAYSTYYSDVELSDEAFVTTPRSITPKSDKLTLITVGTLENFCKAIDVLIDAVSMCIQEGLNLELVIVGDGEYRPDLEAQARKLGIQERVFFRGQLPSGKAVLEQLDMADMFVLPSRQESLPRALIEAMARGLPCIGSNIGGIPELLLAEDLVIPGDTVGLATKIQEVFAEPERILRMSTRNLKVAKEYNEKLLKQRRLEFYKYIKEVTEISFKNQN
ncbi:glycosyltransferase family 4 protein [Komarekiella sp. 'clone 1']|uniref:Glycosyltransferase family 4 protein n=1 Tax=Komarekiella delphini-convector SJRDD-AB1 TaxID=2593771 RepID=A0AA40SX76_9NOST|nr:glycosyltransferase family 4 protein [Komarekiella delphini-convector]MBD6616775.1 glycosyltransferase family 4 protein [Komarekiella delphini-convector SJRDD-AB1]